MTYANARLPNGKECGFTLFEVVLPVRSLEGLSEQQIGSFIVDSLIPRVHQFSEYLSRSPVTSFDAIEEFDAAVREIKDTVSLKNADRKRTRDLRQEVTNNYAALFLMIGRRDGFLCQHCGSCASDLEIDHVHPISRGGDNAHSNLQLLCGSCNRKKSDRLDAAEADLFMASQLSGELQ